MLRLALRYLLARKRQTLLMLLGVVLGTAAFVALSGLLLGFKDYLVDQLVNNAAAVQIEPADGAAYLKDPGLWRSRLAADPAVAAFSPQLAEPALFSAGTSASPGVLVGCDPALQTRVTNLASYVTAGRLDLAQADAIALGAELAAKTGAKLGSRVRVSSASGALRTFTVAALFKTGVQQADTLAYAPLKSVQTLNACPGRINAVAVRLKDYSRAAELAGRWSRSGPDQAESWDRRNANIVDTFKAEDMVRFLSLGAVLLVAGFGIYNVLNMTVAQKRLDIAILRSMGYGRRDVLALFLWQGLLLGLAGAILGTAAGLGLSLALRTVSFGGNPLGSGTGRLAVSLAPAIYAQAAAFALGVSTLSAAFPAHKAGGLDPIEIIRAGAA